MSRVWSIARHEFMVNVRRPGFIIVTLMVPLLGALALLVAAFFGGQASDFLERQFAGMPEVSGVVDQAGLFTPILPEYQDDFRPFPDEAAGRAALDAGDIDSLLVIPSNYMETGTVNVLSEGTAFQSAVIEDSGDMRRFFVDHLLEGQVSPAVQTRVADPVRPVMLALDGADEGADGGPMSMAINIMLPYFLGILLVVTIFTSSGYLLRSVAEEKTSRVIEIVVSSVTAQQLLAGKVLGLGALGLLQVLIWLLSSVALSGGAVGLLGVSIPLMARPEVFVLALVYYILGFLVYAVLMGAGGALGTNMQESQQIAGIFSMMAATPFFLAGFLFSNPNILIARVLSWFPLTGATMMLLRLPMTEVPVVDIIGSIVMLLITVPVVLWAGAKVFRMGLLMYGKRPGVRQIWRTLREA